MLPHARRLQPHEVDLSELDHHHEIAVIEIEPRSACELDCAHCDSKARRRLISIGLRRKPVHQVLDPSFATEVLRALANHEKVLASAVITIAGSGEPLASQHTPAIAAAARKAFPNSKLQLFTSGWGIESQQQMAERTPRELNTLWFSADRFHVDSIRRALKKSGQPSKPADAENYLTDRLAWANKYAHDHGVTFVVRAIIGRKSQYLYVANLVSKAREKSGVTDEIQISEAGMHPPASRLKERKDGLIYLRSDGRVTGTLE